MGLLIGATPLYGLHLILVMAVCVPLKLDVPLSYLAAAPPYVMKLVKDFDARLQAYQSGMEVRTRGGLAAAAAVAE